MRLDDFRSYRKQRQEAYTRVLLRYLAYQGYVTAKTLQTLFGLADISSVRSKLKGWLSEGYIEAKEFPNPLGGRPAKVYTMTPHGRAFASYYGFDAPEKVTLSTSRLLHSLFMQETMLALKQAGFYGFEREHGIENAVKKYGHLPDYVCRTRSGHKIMVEAERSLKSLNRYRKIFKDAILAKKAGHADLVLYVVPDKRLKASLVNLLNKACGQFTRSGITFKLDTWHDLIKVVTIDEIQFRHKIVEFVELVEMNTIVMLHRGSGEVLVESLGDSNEWFNFNVDAGTDILNALENYLGEPVINDVYLKYDFPEEECAEYAEIATNDGSTCTGIFLSGSLGKGKSDDLKKLLF